MDLLALMIASFTPPALIGALVGGVVGWLLWGWFGAALGVVVGYCAGMWFARRFWGIPISQRVKGWISLLAFLGGLTVLAVATR